MALLLNQIEEAIQKPQKANIIRKAIKHENRIRFHAESFMEPSEISQPLTVFLDWVKTLIPKDKYKIFVSLFQFPTPVIQLSNTIFNELERVFDGQNPVFQYQFTDSYYRDDWEWYRQEMLKEPGVWRKKGWDAVRTAINSVLIVDLPGEQTSEYPEPYFYFLGIENVIDYSYKNGKLEWIVFKQPGNKIAAFDDTYYRVFSVNEHNKIEGEPVETEHGLGFCPARFFWSTELIQKQPDLKKAPLSPQLANLDWLLFFSISKRHLDLYAPYPIYSSYEADCDFQNNATGDYCDGGYLRNSDQQYKVLRDGTVEQCPVCSEKRLAGVGSFIEVPVPEPNGPDLRNPVQITSVDKSSLDYNVEEVKRVSNEVFTSIVGLGGDVQQKQSINELQVEANFESRLSVLNSLKGNFEAAIKFVDDTICQLRYGENFIGSSVSMGTEFYIYSVDDLYAQYKKAKENGASEAELDNINEQIIATENRNNPSQMQRMLILKQLEPYRHFTLDELIKLSDKDLLNKDLLKIKINFNTFVDRFERENTNILEFGSQLDFDKKINIINEKFKEYVREQNDSTGGQQNPGQQIPGNEQDPNRNSGGGQTSGEDPTTT